MNNNFKKALCISAVCVLLASNVSFADTNYEEKKKELSKLEKKVKNFEKSICSNKEQYIANLNEIANINLFLNNPQVATDTLNKQEKFIIQNEGKHSVQLVPIFLKKAEIYSFSNIDTTIVNDNLKKAEEIINKNSTNTDIKIEYLHTLIRIAREKDEHYNALSLLKELEKIKNVDNMTKTYTQIELSETYGILKDFKNAKKALNVAYNLAITEYNNGNKYVLYDYYVALINFHKYKLEYTNAINTYNKLNILLAKDKDATEHSKNVAVFALVEVQKEFKYLDEVKKFIDNKKPEANDNDDLMKRLQDLEKDYYFDLGEYDKFKDILDEQKNFNKKYNSNHLIQHLSAKESLIDYYKNTNKLYKAMKIAEKEIENLDNIKDKYPGVYGYWLKKVSELYAKNGDKDKAIETYKKGLEYTKNIFPDNSYRRVEELSTLIRFYLNKKDYTTALKYTNNALKIIKENNYEKTRGALDIYNCLYEIYFDTKNVEKAKQTIDKMIKTTAEIYGENHIYTLEENLKKLYLFSVINDTEESTKLINKIKNTKVEGINPEFWTFFNTHLATKYMNTDKEIAIQYAIEARKYAIKTWQINNTNDLISEIYKQQAKKFKSLKYKLK